MTGTLDAIRARHAAATPGPWRWFGSGGRIRKAVKVYLATVNRGRIFVMDFVRSGWRDAQPRFQVRRSGMGLMTPSHELFAYEVEYRDDISGITHPDAEFLAHSWEDVRDLLDEVDRLRAASTKAAAELRHTYGHVALGQNINPDLVARAIRLLEEATAEVRHG